MSDPWSPLDALRRVLVNLMLDYAGLRLDLAGIVDFLGEHSTDSDALHRHLTVYREHHEHEIRDLMLTWVRTDPQTDDLDQWFRS